ncbi:hypothetical protein HJG60_009641 [Phyllostomus discolor]|uniref:Uncharacterized protein n=1 Tax=Phyllostomus discolor TaxID=89673 RepID=A0A834BC89_9CHIR|nr:hypothetical protein HJG60_009641 [Phyllostomus discolor]
MNVAREEEQRAGGPGRGGGGGAPLVSENALQRPGIVSTPLALAFCLRGTGWPRVLAALWASLAREWALRVIVLGQQTDTGPGCRAEAATPRDTPCSLGVGGGPFNPAGPARPVAPGGPPELLGAAGRKPKSGRESGSRNPRL